MRTSLLRVVMIIVGVLSLRLVPKRWESVDLKARPWGLTVSAESNTDDPEQGSWDSVLGGLYHLNSFPE